MPMISFRFIFKEFTIYRGRIKLFQFGKGKEFLHSILLSTEIIFQQISQDAKFHDIENQDDEEVKF